MTPTTCHHHHSSNNLLASIDIGTNSFKLLVARRLSSDLLLPIHRHSIPLHPPHSPSSFISSLSSLLPNNHHRTIPLRAVATYSLRSAPDSSLLLSLARSHLGLDIRILSGVDEARLTYLGVLHFLPPHSRSNNLLLAVDIGGGSTEVILGRNGGIVFSASLDLGHVILTENNFSNSSALRSHVRTVLDQSGIAEKIRNIGFQVAVGSSGTVKAIERAIQGSDYGRDWKFNRKELRKLVEKITDNFDKFGAEGVRRLGFSKRRAESILAGGILLMEIFEVLGIREMEVSGYGLGEGVIAEMMMAEENRTANCLGNEIDFGSDVRLRSVLNLAVRFGSGNGMEFGGKFVGIAKDIFDGIRKCGVATEDGDESLACLDEMDFEYIEAAILLHNIGRVIGKKGYHKSSYQIIKNGGHLLGYNSKEIELIALLARFHRKKFPNCDDPSLQELPVEMKKKLRVLCVIVRLSLSLPQCLGMISQGLEVLCTHEGFRLVIRDAKQECLDPCGVQRTLALIKAELRPELDHFEQVFQRKFQL